MVLYIYIHTLPTYSSYVLFLIYTLQLNRNYPPYVYIPFPPSLEEDSSLVLLLPDLPSTGPACFIKPRGDNRPQPSTPERNPKEHPEVNPRSAVLITYNDYRQRAGRKPRNITRCPGHVLPGAAVALAGAITKRSRRWCPTPSVMCNGPRSCALSGTGPGEIDASAYVLDRVSMSLPADTFAVECNMARSRRSSRHSRERCHPW